MKEKMRKIRENMCRIREIGAKGDKTVVVTRKEAVDYALEKIENGRLIAVKLSGEFARLVKPELLEAEVLTPEETPEVLVIPAVRRGC